MSLTIPYWKECTKPNCRPLVNKGSCYAVKVKKLDKDGKPEIDDCNEIIYENKIFVFNKLNMNILLKRIFLIQIDVSSS